MNGTARAKALTEKLWHGHLPFASFPQRLIAVDKQGWNSNHSYLTELIERDRPEIVLEIGVWKGGSVTTMAKRMKELGLDSAVIAVDTWLGSFENWTQERWFADLSFSYGYPQLFYKFMANIVDSGVQDYVVPIPLDSLNASIMLRMEGVRLDALHIDGCHDYRGIRSDLNNWWELLKPGGWLIVDNYNDDNKTWPQVRKATDEFLAGTAHRDFEFRAGKCRVRKAAPSAGTVAAAVQVPRDGAVRVSNAPESTPQVIPATPVGDKPNRADAKIVDTFIFFNEIDTLEVRLKSLASIVDDFVLVESAEAFSGVRKPLIFEEHRSRFAPYLDRIRHIVVPGLPPLREDTEQGRFWLESFQRDAIMLGLVGRQLKKDDIVLVSDADEIPSLAAIETAARTIRDDEICVFRQQSYQHFFDAKLPREEKRWRGTIAVRYGAFGRHLPDALRKIARAADTPGPDRGMHRRFIENAGWHLSYFGGKAAVQYKNANFAHGARSDPGKAQVVPPGLIVQEAISNLRPFNDQLRSELDQCIAQLDRDLPPPVLDDLARYYHLFRRSSG